MAVAAGYDFTYILEENGDVWAVGNNLGGQLGFKDGMSRKKTEVVMSGVAKIAAGESHGLFLKKDGNQVFATGANFAGQLGDGTTIQKFEPVEVQNLNTPQDVAAGGDGSCFAEFQLRCSGSNLVGQLGLRDDKFVLNPANVEEVTFADSMAPGETHSLFLNHNEVMVTGMNSSGQLGNDTFPDLRIPQIVASFNRGELTTTMASPTPAPTPTQVPTPAPVPSPNGPVTTPIREPGSDEEGPTDWPWQMLVAGIASGLGVVCVVMCVLDRQTPAPDGETAQELGQRGSLVV